MGHYTSKAALLRGHAAWNAALAAHGDARAAFTLIELITVISIMGLIAALAAPTLSHFRKGDAILSANRQMLDAVARARQYAISEHSTVYMVFVETNFWGADPQPFISQFTDPELKVITNLIPKQLAGYNFLTMRSIGDQPGRYSPHYLGPWQSLPDGFFIPYWKFTNDISAIIYITNYANRQVFAVTPFSTNGFPFPTEQAFYKNPPLNVTLPYIAFDYLGRVISETNLGGLYHDAYIPLAQGNVVTAVTETAPNSHTPVMTTTPTFSQERPPDNSRTAFNLIHIDWLTGRARVEHQEIQP